MVVRHSFIHISATLGNKQVAVLGYGNQGRAQALNLRDQGAKITIGLRSKDSKSAKQAIADGFQITSFEEASINKDWVALLSPDESHKEIMARISLSPNTLLVFAHGFGLHHQLFPLPKNIDVVVVAPVGPGDLLRKGLTEKDPIPGFVAIAQDSTGDALARALQYAKGIALHDEQIFETTIKEEVVTDLFGEQCVIVGGIAALIEAGIKTLVDRGYSEELAYFECGHQMKLLADLIQKYGLRGMRERISTTAQFGDLTRGPRVISDKVEKEMAKILDEIESGQFAQELLNDQSAGYPQLLSLKNKRTQCDHARAKAFNLDSNPQKREKA